MKPVGPASGHVDGAWWPRSGDLAHELPGLLTELAGAGGTCDRIAYNLGEWPTTPRRVRVDGRTVRLSGYHTQGAHTLDLLSHGGTVTTILVVPTDCASGRAADIMSRAAEPGGRGDVDELLGTADAAGRVSGR